MPDQDDIVEYASPPCFMHELMPDFRAPPARDNGWDDVLRWRKAERKRLIEARLALSADERQARSERIASLLDLVIGKFSGRVFGAYWPFRGEPDLRPLAEKVWAGGGMALFPVVVAKATPLVFRAWRSGEPLEKGVWNIPVPAQGEVAEPDVVIAPVVGYDSLCYRLGYGGGFFDRTLAAHSGKPVAIGVGYRLQKIETIRPQSYDIPMSAIVTEEGTVRPQRALD